MALIIEDGTIVDNANSYVTDAEYTSFAQLRGYTIGSSGSERERELIKAMDYLEGLRHRYKGYKASRSQPLQFPRVGVYFDNYGQDGVVIYKELKLAQMELAKVSREFDLLPNSLNENIQSASLGDLSVTYFNGSATNGPQLVSAFNHLKPLLTSSNTVTRA